MMLMMTYNCLLLHVNNEFSFVEKKKLNKNLYLCSNLYIIICLSTHTFKMLYFNGRFIGVYVVLCYVFGGRAFSGRDVHLVRKCHSKLGIFAENAHSTLSFLWKWPRAVENDLGLRPLSFSSALVHFHKKPRVSGHFQRKCLASRAFSTQNCQKLAKKCGNAFFEVNVNPKIIIFLKESFLKSL